MHPAFQALFLGLRKGFLACKIALAPLPGFSAVNGREGHLRTVVQRVKRASVEVDQRIIGEIEAGLCVYVSVENDDQEADVLWMCTKIVHMRLFPDTMGKMNNSVIDTGGAVLLISNFTIHGAAHKGRRPSFAAAARPEHAIPLYESLAKQMRAYLPTQSGEFGAHMLVYAENDGPVNILLDSRGVF